MRVHARTLRLLVPLALALGVQAAWAQDGAWKRGFNVPDLDGDVRGLTSFDTAAGTRLIAVGGFETAGPFVVNHVAAWDGSQWSALGSGIDSAIAYPFSATAFDDGSGPVLYVGGRFDQAGGVPATNVARWDGSAWSALGAGLDKQVLTLASFDDGSGPALFAGGSFTTAGGQPAQHIARWDGANWTPLGSGVGGDVNALAVYDEGQGPALFVAGSFSSAGGVPAPGIARWNGNAWSALAPGLQCGIGALAVYDDGTGPGLYAAGVFAQVAGAPRRGVARWKNAAWTYVKDLGYYPQPHASAVFDAGQGAGPELFFAGSAFKGGGVWKALGANPDGAAYSYPSDPSDIRALAAVELGSGPELFVGGWFTGMQSVAPYQPLARALNVAAWNGMNWARLGSLGQGLDAGVGRLATLANGSVTALGDFSLAGDQSVRGAALWNGADWQLLADGSTGIGVVIADPSNAVGGAFYAAVGDRVRHWNGAAWSDLTGLQGGIKALAFHDGGTGSELVAAGTLDVAGAVPGQALARWDGAAWHELGLRGKAVALAAWAPDAGAAQRLVATGEFDDPLSGPGVALLESGTWSFLGSGVIAGDPAALAVLEGPSGAQLYLGGNFDSVAGVAARSIARWDGAAWSPLGSGVVGEVYALAAREVGTSEELIVAGQFERAGDLRAQNIARWSGSFWSTLGPAQHSGTNLRIHALAVVGPAVYAGGVFTQAGGMPSTYFACWGP